MNDTLRDNISDSYDFKKLRMQNAIYVDKTAYLYRLVSWQLRSRFIVTRPRRFGKSLMISTLQHIFEGHKELFNGLYIAEKTDYDWQPVKVLRFDMSRIETQSPENFQKSYARYVKNVLTKAGAEYSEDNTVAGNFANAMESLAGPNNEHPIAVLIDEYDAPISGTLADPRLMQTIRRELYEFYKKLRTRETSIRFMMMTGVTCFLDPPYFPEFNSLTCLNGFDEFATMLGYTEAELDTYFSDHMKAHAKVMGVSDTCYRKELKHWHNGYCFGRQAETVYNPYSIATTLSRKDVAFGSDWSQSGHSVMLEKLLKQFMHILPDDINGEIFAFPRELSSLFDLWGRPTDAILYQSGYLTIDRYIPGWKLYVLRLPNEEIRQDLCGLLFKVCTKKSWADLDRLINFFVRDNIQGFMETLQSNYKDLVYGTTEMADCEFDCQRALQFLFAGEGFHTLVEKSDGDGHRSDMVVQRKNHVYVFEFKVDEGADVALTQIVDRDYMGQYRLPGNKITLIGLSFKRDSHKLQKFAIEQLNGN